jgi:hypothetical protein
MVVPSESGLPLRIGFIKIVAREKKCPQYVIVETEPAIEIRRVSNLHVETAEDRSETVTWDEPTAEGGVRHGRQGAVPNVDLKC